MLCGESSEFVRYELPHVLCLFSRFFVVVVAVVRHRIQIQMVG